MLRLSPRGATYEVSEDLQTVLKYLARRLNVSPGTIIAMGVAAIEEAVKVQEEDAYVISVAKDGQVAGCKLRAAIAHAQNKEQ